MNTSRKLHILKQVYDIYGSFADSLDLACRKHCSHCCTRNVTLTSLEAVDILESLESADRNKLLRNLQSEVLLQRFQPRITINEIAERCSRDENLPQETCDPDWGPCPLLEDRSCPIYPLRPFACRCMISRRDCKETGYADTDEFVLTVNTVFLQVIEHLDSGGCTGNFIDTILYLSKAENMRSYRQNRLACGAGRLIRNRPLTVLMIPPQHRTQAAPLIRRLQQIAIA